MFQKYLSCFLSIFQYGYLSLSFLASEILVMDVPENANQKKVQNYGRDILLQLRLHPLSLQKPKDLPGMEVVKEKLCLDDINEPCSTSANYQTSFKPEYSYSKHEYPLSSYYLNRLYPYCFPPHGYNGLYQGGSSKLRSSFHSYYNSLKKHCITSHQCYKESPIEECLWAKRSFQSSDDLWKYYPSHLHSNFIKKRDHLEAVPKTRKKLPIIDPVTGENVLETVTSIQQEEQSDTYPVQENSDSSENCPTINNGGKYEDDYFCNTEVIDEPSLRISNETYVDSTSEENLCDKRLEKNVYADETLYDDKFTLTPDSKTEDGTTALTIEPTAVEENAYELVKNSGNICDASKIVNKKVLKICQNRENGQTGRHDNLQAYCRKNITSKHVCKESVSKQTDIVRIGIKDNISFNQEQQKMAILQSFLRYKKYQLEENARNLDEKRMEIANWEWNVLNEAKRLHDKELWLKNQSAILFNKAQQLDREKMLNKEENKSSGDCPSSKGLFKESQFPEKKFALYNYDAAWNEAPAKIKGSYKNGDSNDYSYFGIDASNPSKVTVDAPSDLEKCKSDVSSLDELEKNIIVAIEKMHSSNENVDENIENKTESAVSSSASQRKGDDSLGYSKGRRFLPEHIKYWLNKRDKSSL